MAAGATTTCQKRATLKGVLCASYQFRWHLSSRARLAKDLENLAETVATFVTVASIQLALRQPARASRTQSTAGLQQRTSAKVGQSDCEQTFAGTRGNDEVAPTPDLPAPATERGGS